MRILCKILPLLFLSSVCFGHVLHKPSGTDVQIAILLDTSGSMNGLIEQAKAQLWNIANDLTGYTKDNDAINFEIALYEYGSSKFPEYQDHLRQVSAFTSDMDLLSDQLFKLTTGGSKEYCGTVIHESVSALSWSDASDMKAIYIAGNESFAQGRYPYRTAIDEAKEKGILVNAIYCGPEAEGISLEWHTAAALGRGSYSYIDHDKATVHIDSPYDEEILRLNELLNKTYLEYGEQGGYMRENFRRQDKNAASYGRANYAKRTIYKTKTQFDNSSWDLVDAYEKDATVVEEADQLPESLKGLSVEEREKLIQEKKVERERIQEEISCFAAKRDAYIEDKKSEMDDENGLEQSILAPLKKEMKKRGYQK